MYSSANYTVASAGARVAASSQRMARDVLSTGNPGLFVAVSAKPQAVSGRLDVPDNVGVVATGQPTTFTVMGVSGIKDMVVWCPSKVLTPVTTQSGTLTTVVHGAPQVRCGFNVDVSLIRPSVGTAEAATVLSVNMILTTATVNTDQSPVQYTYQGILNVPASATADTLFCERIQWVNLVADDHTHQGWDNVLRPQFTSSPNGVIPSVHTVVFQFAPVTGRPVPVSNIALADIRLTFSI